jgi:alcohol dehydrogenase
VPDAVRAASGFDAIAHAVETLVTKRRNAVSLTYTREAWKRLPQAFMRLTMPRSRPCRWARTWQG